MFSFISPDDMDSEQKRQCWVANRMIEFTKVMGITALDRSEISKSQWRTAWKKFTSISKWMAKECFFYEWVPTQNEIDAWSDYDGVDMSEYDIGDF